jgi:uncharacterized protein (TIGR00369 family)
MTTWARQRLDELVSKRAVLPPVVQTMKLGALDTWGEGWIRKIWNPSAEVLNSDGSMFGGYISALGDQALAFATMTVIPGNMTFRTANLNVSFIRVAKDHPLVIEARVVSQTKTMISARSEFRRDDGELIAEVWGQQILQPIPV